MPWYSYVTCKHCVYSPQTLSQPSTRQGYSSFIFVCGSREIQVAMTVRRQRSRSHLSHKPPLTLFLPFVRRLSLRNDTADRRGTHSSVRAEDATRDDTHAVSLFSSSHAFATRDWHAEARMTTHTEQVDSFARERERETTGTRAHAKRTRRRTNLNWGASERHGRRLAAETSISLTLPPTRAAALARSLAPFALVVRWPTRSRLPSLAFSRTLRVISHSRMTRTLIPISIDSL